MAKEATANAPVVNKDDIKPAPAPQPISEVLKPAESASSASASAEPSKRRGRAASKRARKSPPKAAKSKAAEPEILFLVETEESSETFKLQEIATTAELLDVLDENRQIIATRNWREF